MQGESEEEKCCSVDLQSAAGYMEKKHIWEKQMQLSLGFVKYENYVSNEENVKITLY